MTKKQHIITVAYLSLCIFLISASQYSCASSIDNTSKLIEISRKSSVEIYSKSGDSKGSGFIISDQYVATAFHVIASISVDQNKNLKFSIYPDISVKLQNGDVIEATCGMGSGLLS